MTDPSQDITGHSGIMSYFQNLKSESGETKMAKKWSSKLWGKTEGIIEINKSN